MPADFVTERTARGGETAARWLETLPEVIETLLDRWRLRLDAGEVCHGEFAVVIPVRRADERYVIKVSQHAEAVALETLALEVWGGRGAAQLFEAEPALGALLLERLDASRSLFDIPLWDAAPLAGALLARLATVPAPTEIPRLRDLGVQLATSLPQRNQALGQPIPTRSIDTASGLAIDLSRNAGDRLIHADLHYGNILAGAREPWLAIDPRPVAGDAEHAVPELLWTRLHELDTSTGLERLLTVLAETGGLDPQRARGWSIVRSIDYWLWGIEHGLTEDPQRCETIVECLTGYDT